MALAAEIRGKADTESSCVFRKKITRKLFPGVSGKLPITEWNFWLSSQHWKN